MAVEKALAIEASRIGNKSIKYLFQLQMFKECIYKQDSNQIEWKPHHRKEQKLHTFQTEFNILHTSDHRNYYRGHIHLAALWLKDICPRYGEHNNSSNEFRLHRSRVNVKECNRGCHDDKVWIKTLLHKKHNSKSVEFLNDKQSVPSDYNEL